MNDRPLKILLVDDDALVRSGTVELLLDLGHGVIEAGSGAEAVRLLTEAGSFDVVVTDFSMPAMNGIDLAKRIRDAHGALPVIIASGYGDTRNADGFEVIWLVKPYLQEELARTVDKAVGRR